MFEDELFLCWTLLLNTGETRTAEGVEEGRSVVGENDLLTVIARRGEEEMRKIRDMPFDGRRINSSTYTLVYRIYM